MSIERLKPAELGAHVGEVFGVSSWIVVDQHRINEFAHCTNDRQWIHVDVERATRESPFGATTRTASSPSPCWRRPSSK